MTDKISWKTVIAITAIIITISCSTFAITADTFKELRKVDREQRELILEIKVQTEVTINELSHISTELGEIKEILKDIAE